jgi:hypothetical protein
MKVFAFIALITLPLAAQAEQPAVTGVPAQYLGAWINKDTVTKFNSTAQTAKACDRMVMMDTEHDGQEPFSVKFVVLQNGNVDFNMPAASTPFSPTGAIDSSGNITFSKETLAVIQKGVIEKDGFPPSTTDFSIRYLMHVQPNATEGQLETFLQATIDGKTFNGKGDDLSIVRIDQKLLSDYAAAESLCMKSLGK